MNQLQEKILEIMMFVDKTCRDNGIQYCIMGGTALGAVRHGGFIPWDDDIDIFMTPEEYAKFSKAMAETASDIFVLQEWNLVPEYLQYAKVRMNNTAFIEEHLKNRKDIHQGIFVDIMILHKVPSGNNRILKKQYVISKYLTLKGNIKVNWKPKRVSQYLPYIIAKMTPKFVDKRLYKKVYKYDNMTSDYDYIYYITKASLAQGLFKYDIIQPLVDMDFEGNKLLAPANIKEYLSIRYGNYMELPPIEEQKSIQHAEIWSTTRDYSDILAEINSK